MAPDRPPGEPAVTRWAVLLILMVVAACGGSARTAPEIMDADEFTIDEIGGVDTFVTTAEIETDDGTFTVRIRRSGEVTESSITSDNDRVPDARFVARESVTYALTDGAWTQVSEFGPAGLVILLAAPEIAHQLAVEIHDAGEFVGWEDVGEQEAARFDVAAIPESVRAQFYTVVDGAGSVWIAETGEPLRWTATAADGQGRLEWALTDLGGDVEIELPPELEG